jgi:hypothetical protein
MARVKQTVESCLEISIKKLLQDKVVVAGKITSGTLQWFTGETLTFSASCEADLLTPEHATMQLAHRLGGELERYHVWLSATPVRFGGVRWWLHCPASGRPVSKLFLPPDGCRFCCRQVYDLTYASRQNSRRPNSEAKRVARWRKHFGLPEKASAGV